MLKPGTFSFTVWLGLVFACGSLGTDIFSPALPSITISFGTSDFNVQLIMAAYITGLALAQLVFGPLSDRFGRKVILRWGLWLFAVSTLACTLATSIELLIALRFVQGFAASSGLVVARAIARDCFTENRQLGHAMSRMSLMLSLSPVLLPPLGGWLAVNYDWHANFLFLAGIIIFLALSTEFGFKETIYQKDRDALKPSELLFRLGKIIKHHTFIGFMMTGSLCFAGLFAFISNAAFVFKDYFNMSMGGYGTILGIAFAGHSIGIFTSGQLVKKVGGPKLIVIGAILCCFSGISLAVMDYFSASSIISVSCLMTLYLYGAGLVYPLTLAGALHPFHAMAGTASALMGFFVMMTSGITSVLVGIFYTGTPTSLAMFIAVVGTSSLVFFRIFSKENLSKQNKAGLGTTE